MIWIEVVCDGCNHVQFGESYRKGSSTRLKQKAKEADWKIIKGNLYCPDCQKRLNEESEDKE